MCYSPYPSIEMCAIRFVLYDTERNEFLVFVDAEPEVELQPADRMPADPGDLVAPEDYRRPH